MTNRRMFLIKSTMAASAVSFLRPLNAIADFGNKQFPSSTVNKLVILHTSNLFGQYSALQINEKMHGLGGLQNVGKKINQIRNEHLPFLALDAGNMVNGNHQNYNNDLSFYKSMAEAGYDAVTPGQTDLKKGFTHFEQLIKESGLCVVGGRVHSSINNNLFPYNIINKGSKRIGIIKVVTGSKSNSLENTAAVMNFTASQLKEVNKCSVIVCMMNTSVPHTSRLAALSSATDLMISSFENNSIHNTHIVRNKADHEVVLSYAGSKGTMMSRIDLTFGSNGEKINVASKAIFAGAEDESYAGILKRCALYNA